jgi:catechol 2,3-dioxygenase-like lactoylglutathione lyase family enzyme
VPAAIELVRVGLGAPAGELAALERFYRHGLELPCASAPDRLDVAVGGETIAFAPAPDGARPFFHFALLVPGDRFDAAYAWLGERAELLPGPEGSPRVEFGSWDASACYVHDPAGNIVELIAHRGVGERGATGPFSGAELLGVSEIGLVTPDPDGAVAALGDALGLELWAGEPAGLAFVGRKAHTLIVSPPGRGWLPTGRPAEAHPVEVAVAGVRGEPVRLDGGHVVRAS